MDPKRRRILAVAGAFGAAGAIGLHLPGQAAEPARGGAKGKQAEAEVSAPEDLMREHGVLSRILLVYEEALRCLRSNQEIAADLLHRTATLVRRFVEDYHERLEEKFIFPVFEKRGQMVELVRTLRKQHDAGRALTDTILGATTAEAFAQGQGREKFAKAARPFIRMYRPHKAREDTVLFPALHKLLPEREMDQMGDQFEKEEDRLFGEGGFEKTVEQVAAIEKVLGIYDLDKFTPEAGGRS